MAGAQARVRDPDYMPMPNLYPSTSSVQVWAGIYNIKGIYILIRIYGSTIEDRVVGNVRGLDEKCMINGI